MNILLAFKAEPDAGMLAEKEWQAAAQGNIGPDVSLLRSLLGADEQAAAALLLAQRKNGTPMSLTALSMGDERALHCLRYLMALGLSLIHIFFVIGIAQVVVIANKKPAQNPQ